MPLFTSGPTADSVIARLGNTKDTTHHYIVLAEYIEAKKSRIKSDAYIAGKIDHLEEALAKYSDRLATDVAPAFARIRQDKGLPPSRLFPAISISPAADSAPPAYPGHATPYSSSSTPVVAASPRAVVPAVAAARALSVTSAARASLRLSRSTTRPPRSGASSPAPLMVDGEEQLAMLRDYDTVFLVDDSGSMAGALWAEAKRAISGVVAHAIKYDEDGIDVYFLNNKTVGRGVKRARDVDALFQGVRPQGATPTGARLDRLLKDYKKELDAGYRAGQSSGGDCFPVKPLNLIVITDGAPTDDPESALVSFARYLDKYDFPLSQCGIQMFQIGRDPAATEALQDLDDALENRYDIRDIVDTVPYQGEMTADLIVKVLLGGINRRLDRKAAP